MAVVPRHLFFDPSLLEAASDEDKLIKCYTYDGAMPATAESNESSPEVTIE